MPRIPSIILSQQDVKEQVAIINGEIKTHKALLSIAKEEKREAKKILDDAQKALRTVERQIEIATKNIQELTERKVALKGAA